MLGPVLLGEEERYSAGEGTSIRWGGGGIVVVGGTSGTRFGGETPPSTAGADAGATDSTGAEARESGVYYLTWP